MIKIAGILLLMMLASTSNAQRVTYSAVEKEDSRYMNVSIVGKVGNNIVAYKNARTDNYISVYNTDMTLKEKIKLAKMPTKIINSDFIAYQQHFYMIYQYQKRSIIYCEAIKLNADGKLMVEEPILLDTTNIPLFANDNKIYSVEVSENKQRIAVIKGSKKNDRYHNLGVVLLDANLNKLYKKFFTVAMDGRNNYLEDFDIDNDGDVYFAKCYSTTNNDYVSKFELSIIKNGADSIHFIPFANDDKTLDDVNFKIDNQNKRVIMQSLYYTKRRGNIEGIMAGFFEKNTNVITKPILNKFSDSFKIEAKGINNTKFAFNDFFLKNVFVKKDGSYILTSENYVAQPKANTGNTWSRWDYYSGTPTITSYDYYNMGSRNWYWNNWDRNGSQYIYSSENIAVMNFDKNGNLVWTNVIHKDQRDDAVEDFISHQVILTGGAIHFLFNEKDRNDFLLYDNSISPTGVVTRHPTLKNLDRQYQIMPRRGEQISAREIIFPCVYKNYICFAKLEY